MGEFKDGQGPARSERRDDVLASLGPSPNRPIRRPTRLQGLAHSFDRAGNFTGFAAWTPNGINSKTESSSGTSLQRSRTCGSPSPLGPVVQPREVERPTGP